MEVVFDAPDVDEPYSVEVSEPPRKGDQVSFSQGNKYAVSNVIHYVDAGEISSVEISLDEI